MNRKQAQEVAEQVVEYLFLDNDKPKKPVARLMLVYGSEEYKNPGWGRESIRDAIVDRILKSAQQITALDASPKEAQVDNDQGSRQ